MNSLKNHLLISAPHMHDNIFKNTVIYICEHNLEGAMGLIINKPMDSATINDQKFMNNMSNSQFDNLKMKLYFGGPILLEKFIALHTNELKTETAIPLNNKISISYVEEIDRNMRENFNYKLFYGHSGWSPGQLEREIENGDWLLQNSKTDLLFNVSDEGIWEAATRSLGINIIDIANISGRA